MTRSTRSDEPANDREVHLHRGCGGRAAKAIGPPSGDLRRVSGDWGRFGPASSILQTCRDTNFSCTSIDVSPDTETTMNLRMDKTLLFWVDVAYQDLKNDHANLTKRQLVAHILREYESRGDAMRYLNVKGKIVWKATPSFLNRIADAERDAQDELDDD